MDTPADTVDAPTGMAIEPYNENAFKVVGDSKPYRFTLRRMGGKWNRNLEGGMGWIFSVERLESVQDLVDRINSGEVEPDQVNPVGRNKFQGNNFRQNYMPGNGQQMQGNGQQMPGNGQQMPGNGHQIPAVPYNGRVPH